MFFTDWYFSWCLSSSQILCESENRHKYKMLGITKSEQRHRYIKRRTKVTFNVPNTLLLRLYKSAENISEVLPLYLFGIVIEKQFWHAKETSCVPPNSAARGHYHNVVQNTWRSREIKTIRLWHSAFRTDATQHYPSPFPFFFYVTIFLVVFSNGYFLH
jgi:hypothetical protein